jgi:murein DD-endopeptidase MepM/ murein hydrolase activator NlpD
MASTRLRAVFLFLILALVLTTTGCRGTSARIGHHSGGRPHVPSVSTSSAPDPGDSAAAESRDLARRFAASNETPLAHRPMSWKPPLPEPLRVTRPFQPPPSRYAAGHRGVDLAGSGGEQIRTAGDGTVTWAGVLAGRGVVVVSHGQLRTTYEPVVAAVRKGQAVHAGDPIGRLQPGHAGCPVAACLHWGLLRGSDYLDPLSLIRLRVRLLPLGGG